jgi:hypothetical protein
MSSESTAPDWVAAGSAWVAADPNAETRGAIQAMVDAKDLAGLEQALGARMAFGTSGLRASMGTGAVHTQTVPVYKIMLFINPRRFLCILKCVLLIFRHLTRRQPPPIIFP